MATAPCFAPYGNSTTPIPLPGVKHKPTPSLNQSHYPRGHFQPGDPLRNPAANPTPTYPIATADAPPPFALSTPTTSSGMNHHPTPICHPRTVLQRDLTHLENHSLPPKPTPDALPLNRRKKIQALAHSTTPRLSRLFAVVLPAMPFALFATLLPGTPLLRDLS